MREKLKSTNLACTLAGMAKSTWYYKPKENLLNNEISDRMKEIAIERPRFGSPRMTVLIRREFGTVNHKRIERLYKEARLTLPRKRRKRKWHGRKNQMFVPLGPSQRWSMDFMEDKTVDGRRIRIFNVVDDFSREAIICQAERSFSGHRIVRELEQVMESRDIKPQSIVMDNGSEFTSRAFLGWAQYQSIQLDFIQPGKPTQNAFVESFNGSFRDECLNINWFYSLEEAQEIIEKWKDDYNKYRPHSSLNYRSPKEYLLTFQVSK
jgi:putative transposase